MKIVFIYTFCNIAIDTLHSVSPLVGNNEILFYFFFYSIILHPRSKTASDFTAGTLVAVRHAWYDVSRLSLSCFTLDHNAYARRRIHFRIFSNKTILKFSNIFEY